MNIVLAEAAVEAVKVAGVTGSISSTAGVLAAAIGVGLIGAKAVESVGRNPGASGKILVQSILGMALAEGLGLLSLFVK
ncbi:MAG: ATP synthase F0 subunit C [Verrucomicrobiota bacterium]|nr:ATP synthase F0 subunit C [Verrucomicrobiota bacterium]